MVVILCSLDLTGEVILQKFQEHLPARAHGIYVFIIKLIKKSN